MAITLPDNIFVATNAPLDVRYGPYVSTTIVAVKIIINNTISVGDRYEGLTVGIILGSAPLVEYWFYGGVDISNLVEKSFGGGEITVLNQEGPTGTPSALAGAYEKFNFVNYDPNDLRVFAQEDASDATQANIYFPPPAAPTYPPYFNQTGALVGDPLSARRKQLIVSDPSTNGSFETGGWDDLLPHSSYLMVSNNPTISFATAGNVPVLGFSPVGRSTADGCKIQVEVIGHTAGIILSTATTPVLDQNAVHNINNIGIIITNYADIVDPYGAATQHKAIVNISVDMKAIFLANSLEGGRYSVKITFTADQILPVPGTTTAPASPFIYTMNEVFADIDPTSPDTSVVTFVDATMQTEFNSYLSGVKYLKAGSTFKIQADGIKGINGNTQGKTGSYLNPNLVYSPLTNINTLGVSDKAWAPTNGTVTGYDDRWDNINVGYDYDSFTIQTGAYSFRGKGGASGLTISDPWNNASESSTNNLDVLILTPGGTLPSDLTEYFNNESRRLSKASLSAAYVSWNSQTALTNAAFGTKPNAATNTDFQDACQIVDGFTDNGAKLISANTFDLSNGTTTLIFSGYLPTQATDFTSFTKNSVYHRQFGNGPSTGSPFASWRFVFTGSNWGTGNSNINDALDDQSVKIYIRRVASNAGASFGANTAVPLNLHNWNNALPTEPNRYYSPGAFTDGGSGIDTHSATIRSSASSGDTVLATFGSFSADIGIFVEIQYLNQNIDINSITWNKN
tara:strand:+ start:639 stop:2855 length:2217 start_codon:yes stop_codon:yes gene_type:complete